MTLHEPGDLPARLLLQWTRLLSRHRILLTIILIAQAVLFSSLSAWIIWQPDVLQFFSADSAEVQSVHQISSQSGLANQLRFDVHLTTPAHEGDAQIISSVTHDLAAALIASKEFRYVWIGADASQLAAAYAHLVTQAPLLLGDPKRIESRLTPGYINQRFADVRNHLADPDGEFLLRQLITDPLNLADTVPDRLQSLAPSAENAQSASFQNGLLMTTAPDGRAHAMIVAQPNSLPSNQKAAQATLAAANAAIAQIQKQTPALEVWIVGPHRGYVENAQRIITDVTRISALGSLAVALAIALYFRRATTALLCLIPPVIGVGLALGLAGIAHITLPLILLGFAGLLCGSTTDYGILIIAESRRFFAVANNTWHPNIPALAARRMLGPITMSVATSVTGFAALALSSSPGLKALGLFVAAATLCIWLVTFLILPAFITRGMVVPTSSPQSKTKNPKSKIKFLSWTGTVAFLILTAWFANSALHVRFNTNPRSLDGSSRSARSEEDAFAKVWGDLRNRGIVLVTAPTPEEALLANQRVFDYLQDQKNDGLITAITSAASILPDQPTLEAHAQAWSNFWTPDRREHLRQLLAAAATSNGFKPAPYLQYADQIASPKIPNAQDRLTRSPAALLPGLIDSTPTSTTLATIVQMNEIENQKWGGAKIKNQKSLRLATAWAPELRARFPDALILFGNLLFFDATERARAEGEHLAPWCILAILLPLILYFRSLRKAWLTLTCLIVGFIWVLAAAQLTGDNGGGGGGGLNLLSLVPILFTLGVAVDYGIYASTAPGAIPPVSHNSRPIFLCALTTILGSGSLALASHPALRWLGITLVAGITGGYLTSHFLVAPLVPRPSGSASLASSKKVRVLFRFALNIFLFLLTLLLCIPPLTDFILAQQRPFSDHPQFAVVGVDQIAPRTFITTSGSWMRYHPTSTGDSGIWEIQLVGAPYSRGAAVSQLAAPIDERIESEMLDQLDHLLPNEFSRYLITRAFAANLLTLPHYIPQEYQEEIYASATASGLDPYRYLAPSYPRILSYHALHDISQMLIDNPLIIPNDSGCTGIVSLPAFSAATNGHLLLARNFDFEGGESFSKQKSITYVIPPETGPDAEVGGGIPFAHVAWPGLAGCVTGINQQKIALFLNAAATADFRRIGTPTIIMARDILQHARSLDDAEKIIARTQTFVSDIIVVADGKTGQARVFEKSPSRLASYDVDQSAVVTNHLITPTFESDPVNRSRREQGTTLQRDARARQLLDRLHQNVTPENLTTLLRDKHALDDKPLGLGNRNAIDGLIACHSVIIDVTSAQLWVAAWPCAEGEFIGIDIPAMLDRNHASQNGTRSVTEGRGNATSPNLPLTAPASLPSLPVDTMMTDGRWPRFLASRIAAEQSHAALLANDPRAALDFADAVLRNNPGFYLGHELRGRALLKTGDLAAAKIELEEALHENPPYTQRRTAIEDLIKKCDTH